MENDVLVRLLGAVKDKRVLELGCDAGARAVTFAHAGATVIGVDPSVDLTATSGTLRPGGIVHLPTLTGGELAFATIAGPHLVDAMAHAEHLDVRCHADALTDATLVVHTVSAPAGSPPFAVALERMQALLARTAVRELTDDVAVFLHDAELTHRQQNAARHRAATPNDPTRDDRPGAID